jgi:hypothetical protein
MLAEIYLLKLEAAVRAAKEAATTASTSRFVPVTYRLARRPNPVFHRALAICPLAAKTTPLDSEHFRPAPKVPHANMHKDLSCQRVTSREPLVHG